MTKKRWIILGTMTACVLAMMVGCIVLLNSPNQTYEVNQMHLFSTPKENVEKIKIETPESNITIYRGEDGLLHFEGSDEPVDQGRAESLVTFASYMYVTKEIEKDAQDLSKYGLEPPESVITVTLKDGTEYVINYGYMSTDKTARYLTLNDEKTVYTQGELSSRIILKDLDSLRNLDLPEHNADLLTGIAYENFRGEKIVMSALPDQFKVGDCTYQMSEPATLFVPKYTIDAFQSILDTAEFFEYKGTEKLSEYGLENPKTVKFAFSDGASVTLYVGAKEEGAQRYYVMAEDKPGIYTLNANMLDFLNLPALKMALPNVVPGNIDDTAQIIVNYNGAEYTINAKNGAYTVNDKEITAQEYQNLFDLIKKIQIVDFTNQNQITKDSIATIKQVTTNGLELQIEFNNYGTDFASVNYGVGAQIYCNKNVLTDFIKQVEALSQ